MVNLIKFYDDPSIFNTLYPVISRERKINNKKLSLRILDWFIKSYSKQYRITLTTKTGESISNIHVLYKTHSNSLCGKLFDPFCRNKRFKFCFKHIYKNNSKCTDDCEFKVTTTTAQLNFLKWCWDHGVIDYVTENIEDIYIDMNMFDKLKRSSDLTKHKERKHSSSCRTIYKNFDKTIIEF